MAVIIIQSTFIYITANYAISGVSVIAATSEATIRVGTGCIGITVVTIGGTFIYISAILTVSDVTSVAATCKRTADV